MRRLTFLAALALAPLLGAHAQADTYRIRVQSVAVGSAGPAVVRLQVAAPAPILLMFTARGADGGAYTVSATSPSGVSAGEPEGMAGVANPEPGVWTVTVRGPAGAARLVTVQGTAEVVALLDAGADDLDALDAFLDAPGAFGDATLDLAGPASARRPPRSPPAG